MRKVIVSEFLTVDGVMQAPGDPNEDRSGGFEHGGWQLRYFDDVFGATVLEGLSSAGGLLLGRRTYEIFAAYWPTANVDDAFTGTMNDLPKYVVSTTLREPLDWSNSRLVKGDLPEAIRALKEEPGNDLRVIGSGELSKALMTHGLVDQFVLMIHPLIMGTGKRLFADGGSLIPLRLADSKISTTGVLLLTYEPADPEMGV
jgi:dihydrofolate reductase